MASINSDGNRRQHNRDGQKPREGGKANGAHKNHAVNTPRDRSQDKG